MTLLQNPISTLWIVQIFGGIAVFIASLELLMQPDQLQENSLFAWTTQRTRLRWLVTGMLASVLNAILRYPNVRWLLSVRLMACVAVCLARPETGFALSCVAVIFTTICLFHLRTPFGLDGADQMMTQVFGALTIAYLYPHPLLRTVCLWFLALQLCLSYATAGIAKCFSRKWLSGENLPFVLGTAMYGDTNLSKTLLKHPLLSRLLSIGVIGLETLFPTCLLLPMSFALIFPIGGIVFHVACARLMSLNTFLWAFLACYPALLHLILIRQ